MRNINDIIRNLILLGLSLVILEPVVSTEVLDAVSAWRGPERRRPEPTFLCDVSKEAAPTNGSGKASALICATNPNHS